MSSRRSFLSRVSAVTAGAFGIQSIFHELHAAGVQQAFQLLDAEHPEYDAANEAFWSYFQQAYTVNPNIINLNNGGVSPAPRVVQEALRRYNDLANEGPTYYMWRIMDQGREPLRAKLAGLGGCDPEEVAINRNATEALNTIIFGLPLQKGDEVLGTLQDYPNMIQAWRQRQLRDGIVYKQISFDFPLEDDDAMVRKFEEAMTPRTKVVHLTHIINWVGQILPVRKIADMAHRRGAEVIIDGAHSFGLLDFRIPDLGGDYFGTSLHKFLSAPIGSGMLWVKKEKIEKIWPLVCNDKPNSGDIRKFETLGTRSFCIEQAIGEAINFHESIGAKRKEERIRYLKDYWARKAMQIPRVRLHTSLKPAYSCSIAGVSIDGMKPEELEQKMFSKFKIHSVGINWENIHCVRITPHVYTRLQDLDRLVMALDQIATGKV
ncbi:MAG: aminotransferase class V-fold PLP-dependent enzyme [Chitinophagaceae bacterium]|jgi:selenocysteine lyase/cysteine desulfurase|nr:aminotransferase class V-fold PLP-dependent enzyme [Chitinophagaceae bacterium]